MEKQMFLDADKHADEVANAFSTLAERDEFAPIKTQLEQLSAMLGSRFGVSLQVVLEVFDNERLKSLPLLRTGLATSAGKSASIRWGDSSPAKYIADGDMAIVPHDYCPCCWGEWDCKFIHRKCNQCGARLGVEVTVLLDTNICPSCEEGSIAPNSPTCSECDFEADPNLVTWG